MSASGTDEVRVRPATDQLVDDLEVLAHEARACGINNVSTLIERWRNGSERYDTAGESMLIAWSPTCAVGVGGIAWCPDVPGALRVRRFFVSASVRRRGIASRLAHDLIETAFAYTDTLSCNAQASDAAAPFWQSMGFEPVDIAGITHLRRRPVDR